MTDAWANIRGIIFDVDGVLTDGRITYTDDGHELKSFHVQDGASIKLLMQAGIAVAVITGRRSPMVAKRCRELGIDFLMQGANSKPEALARLITQGFPAQDLAAVGDDLQDLALFDDAAVCLSITVPNGHPAVRARAAFETERSGGTGVVVELAQRILQAQGKWPY